MTHLIVTRVSLAVCLLALVCAALFAALAAPASAPVATAQLVPADESAPDDTRSRGATLFDRHCARCHDAAELIAMLRDDGAGIDAASARMHGFLREHGAASDAEAVEIVAYLRANAH